MSVRRRIIAGIVARIRFTDWWSVFYLACAALSALMIAAILSGRLA